MILMFGKRVLWSWRTLMLAWLLLATAIGAATSFRGLVPLDARTGQAAQGLDARFEFPLLGAVLEPLMAPAHIILGSPNYRISAFSFAVWLVAVTGCAAFWISGRHNPRPALARRLLVSALRT